MKCVLKVFKGICCHPLFFLASLKDMKNYQPVTLWDLQPHSSGSILSCDTEQLRPYGFFKNQKVKLIHKIPFWGPKIFQVGDCQISINRSLAQKILVQPS